MPYIDPKYRHNIDAEIGKLAARVKQTPTAMIGGRLNYAISRLVHLTLLGPHANYRDFAEAIAVLECAKLELYRAHTGPYEETKREAHGDVA